MASNILFHGPGARAAALAEANRVGRLVAPPFGEEGLKVEEARQLVELMLSTPVGTDVGTLVAGPLDEALPRSTDALLKTLEDFSGNTMRLFLWAHDLGGVSATIRSRCLCEWAPGEEESDDGLLKAAGDALNAFLENDRAALVEAIKDLPRGKERAFLAALSDHLGAELENPKMRQLWEQVRKVSRWRNPTHIEIVAALLPGSSE